MWRLGLVLAGAAAQQGVYPDVPNQFDEVCADDPTWEDKNGVACARAASRKTFLKRFRGDPLDRGRIPRRR